jgi:TonB family protein
MVRALAFGIGFILAFGASAPIRAQEVSGVSAEEIQQHIDHQVAPVYPPIAKAARVQGVVVMDLRIDEKGKIGATKVVSGPPMLQQAAIDCVKQWTFRPFESNGSPIAVAGKVTISFELGDAAPTPKEEEIASRFFPAQDKCLRAVAAHDDSSSAADLCKQTADIAIEFASNVRFIEKRSSFVYAAWALGNNRRFTDALAYARRAVDVVKLGHDDNSGSSAAYGVLGVIEGNLNDLDAADRDLTTAEDFGRKAIAWAESEKFVHADSYKQSLAMYLKAHAALLLAMDRSDDAQKKLDEAAKYKQ